MLAIVYEWLLKKWDKWVYYLAHDTLRRMCERNQGFAYLMELNMREYRKRNPISPEVQRETEEFFKLINEISEDLRTL